MAATDLPRARVCLVCAAPIDAPDLCRSCVEAFALARAAHPASGGPLAPSAPGDTTASVDTDLEFWDAWALLGEAGAHTRLVGDH